jgi:hypothetical protein
MWVLATELHQFLVFSIRSDLLTLCANNGLEIPFAAVL